ncbi:MAG: hypothetical protein LBM13_06215 [Candidatus Ancillula sp.]|jgi:hypothetical protein|nr:hypothetical protein [Candidatus Ancillula sp.]
MADNDFGFGSISKPDQKRDTDQDDSAYEKIKDAYDVGHGVGELNTKNSSSTVADDLRKTGNRIYNQSNNFDSRSSVGSKKISNSVGVGTTAIHGSAGVENGIKAYEDFSSAASGKDKNGRELSDSEIENLKLKGTGAAASGIKDLTDFGVDLYAWSKVSKDGRKTFKKQRELIEGVLDAKNLSKTAKKVIGIGKKLSGIAGGIQLAFNAIDWAWKNIFQQQESPIDTYIRKPFAGDWDKMNSVAGEWVNIGENLYLAAEEINKFLEDIENNPEKWQGEAANAYLDMESKDFQPIGDLIKSANEISTATYAAADLAETLLDNIIDIISTIIEDVTTIAGWAATVAGIPAAIVKGIGLICDIISMITEIAEMISNFVTCVSNYQSVISEIQSTSSEIGQL